jgi:MoxR-like ATPase
LIWQRIAQAQAWIRGRDFITPDDVQDVAEPVLNVRLGLEPMDARRVIQEVLDRVAVPEYQT